MSRAMSVALAKAVQLDQQLVQRLLAFVVAPGVPGMHRVPCLRACRAWGVEAKFGPSEDSFCRVRRPIAIAMGREAGEKWTAAADLQPTLPKSHRLPADMILASRPGSGSRTQFHGSPVAASPSPSRACDSTRPGIPRPPLGCAVASIDPGSRSSARSISPARPSRPAGETPWTGPTAPRLSGASAASAAGPINSSEGAALGSHASWARRVGRCDFMTISRASLRVRAGAAIERAQSRVPVLQTPALRLLNRGPGGRPTLPLAVSKAFSMVRAVA
jgi:hypothetical protein